MVWMLYILLGDLCFDEGAQADEIFTISKISSPSAPSCLRRPQFSFLVLILKFCYLAGKNEKQNPRRISSDRVWS